MKGGELIGTGSSSCIFYPNIPCDNEGKRDIHDDKISKVIYHEESEKQSKNEFKINKLVREIRGYKNWALIYDKVCNPPSINEMIQYDKQGIHDCLDDTSYEYDNFNDQSYMMVGNYGGITSDHYFRDKFNQSMSKEELEKEFINMMKMLKPLYLGIKNLNKNGIIHNDIKYNNIVLDDNKFKLIDFGLSGTLSNNKHFKNRSIREFNTSRIYVFYPLEYILFYASITELENELDKIDERYHKDELKAICYIFNYDYYETYELLVRKIQSKEINEKEMIQKIDVYSLGILIPLLFLDTNIPYPYEGSEMISSFYMLFQKMVHPLSSERISIERAYKEFYALIRKFDKVNKRDKNNIRKKGTDKRDKNNIRKKRTDKRRKNNIKKKRTNQRRKKRV